MARGVLKRIRGSGAGGAWVPGVDRFKEILHATPLRNDLDGCMAGVIHRNLFMGGSDVVGIDASAAGDFDLLTWTPAEIDNTDNWLSDFTDADAALVFQIRYLLRVSDPAVTITPKLRYGSTITTLTTVATLTGPVACNAIDEDFSGSDQYQVLPITMPGGVNTLKAQVTIGGSPAVDLQVWARAYLDLFIQLP